MNQQVSLYNLYLNYINRSTFSIWDDIKSAFKSVPDKLKGVTDLIKELSSKAKGKVQQWIEIFKNSQIFKFFEYFGFSIKKIYEFVKKYSEFIDQFFQTISDYVANTKVGKWTTNELKKLDKYLEKHPILKKASGVAICALLIYINTQMVYVGDPVYDFDLSTAFAALTGTFSVSQIFAGPSGYKLLLMLATGLIVPTFPWNNTAKLVGIIGDMIYNFYSKCVRKTHSAMNNILHNIKSNCKTSGQRKAYNELVKAFASERTYQVRSSKIKLGLEVLEKLEQEHKPYDSVKELMKYGLTKDEAIVCFEIF